MKVHSLSPQRTDLVIQDVSHYAISALDRNGVVVSWNNGAKELKGYEADEVIGKHFSCFYSLEDREAGLPEKALSIALKDGLMEAQGWRYRKDGTRFWANVVMEPTRDESGTHVGFVKITRDFTKQKKTEEELRKSEERFRLLVQGVTDYAIYMLDPEGLVSSWNAGAERFKGYTEREIIGQHFSRFYPPEDQSTGLPQRALKKAVTEGRFEAEGWRVRKDGNRFWAHVVIDPIHNDDGQLIGYTKITRDLTERKLAAEALEKSQEQLFQAQKMEAIGHLMGGVAHDFNNILAAILGSLKLAQRRQAKGEDGDRFIANAIDAAERGATLTQRMLAFARKQELTLEPTDIIGSMEGMIALLSDTIGPGISIRTDYPADLEPVLTDRAQLELAVMNLVVNARDAMPQGGEITLRARRADGSEDQQGFVCLEIEDQGEGMDEDTLLRATEPFFTTKGVGKGTGLGLPMVKGMVEQSGGHLTLRSETGRGTTAEIWLPLAEQCIEKSREETGAVEMNDSKLRILVVDDDVIILLNTVTILEDMDFAVFEAGSGTQALQILENEDVDLLITDFAMPKMTGAELVERAKEIRPDLKVIVASGYADLPEGTSLEAYRLAKPFTEAELSNAITAISEKSGA